MSGSFSLFSAERKLFMDVKSLATGLQITAGDQ